MPAPPPRLQGNIVSWKKQEGDSVQPGDIYCEVETDKVRGWAWQALQADRPAGKQTALQKQGRALAMFPAAGPG